jgi:NADH-quinone oxidoreductase E subunit
VSNLRFSPERLERFQKIVAKYETRQSALLPVLYLAQEQFGYLTDAAMDYVAELLQVPPAHVYEAVSFYVLFKKKDMGRHCLQVCNNITCNMMGAEKLLAITKEELGLSLNEVSSDGKFSLMAVQCLGSCDTAPVVQVNEDYYENLNPGSYRQLLRSLSSGKTPSPREEEAVT